MARLNWYERMETISVEKDLNKNPQIRYEAQHYLKKFINFAAIQRMTYEDDLNAEWEEFQEKYVNNRLFNVDIKLWHRIRKRVFERDNFTCKYCGQVGGKLEVDHMLPISRGGTNDLSNLVTACQHCNRQKHDKTVSEYLKWRDEHE